jgi:hypothetical protein
LKRARELELINGRVFVKTQELGEGGEGVINGVLRDRY